MTIYSELLAPFPVDEIEWRVGATNQGKTKGIALAYLNARTVMDRLDNVCGPQNWQCRYPHANGKTCCEIGIKIDDEWIWKSDGAGDTDFEGVKGAFSDAFKRAAVRWGIGRYLYDLDAPWVDIEQRGRSYTIAVGEQKKLRQSLAQRVGKITELRERANKVFDAIHSAQTVEEINGIYQKAEPLMGQLVTALPSVADLMEQRFTDKTAELGSLIGV